MAPHSDVVLDFFAGSSTTADAVLSLNAEDGGNRKFICVQLAEPCEPSSEAAKAGYRNVAEIGRERIRRAGAAIKEGDPEASDLDTGFRALRVDSSNMLDVYYSPDQIAKTDLLAQVQNIREDRTTEDLLFQVLLDWGVDLSLPISKETIEGKTVHFVDGNALAACFDLGVSESSREGDCRTAPLARCLS